MSDAFLVLNAKGKETVRDFLKNLSTQCDEICVAAAFFCKDRLLGDWTAQGCKLRVVVSLTYPTDASVLRALLALPPRQVSVGFYKGQFHSKLYLFLKEGRPIGGVVGSSNFTGGGLERNIETNILINARVELQALSDHFEVIWKGADGLKPEHIDWYENYLERTRIERSKLKKALEDLSPQVGSVTEAYHYLNFKRRVDEVRTAVEHISLEEWPDVPVYLAIDHFWHWVVRVLAKDEGRIARIRANPDYRKETLPPLFQEYAKWDKAGANHTAQRAQRSLRLRKILGRSAIHLLSKDEAKEVFKATNAGAGLAQRFNLDEKFVRDNELHRIRTSFNYLLWSSDNIVKRISSLLANDNYRLKHFAFAQVQELIGWVQPEKWPPRNRKADKGLIQLGYTFK